MGELVDLGYDAPTVGSAAQGARNAALRLGLRPHDLDRVGDGRLPFALHSVLTGSDRFGPDAFQMSSFRAAGHVFHWVDAIGDGSAWERINLEGHMLAAPDPSLRDFVQRALIELSAEPRTLDFVRRFVTTFIPVEGCDQDRPERQLTSCSLPDFPLAVFFSTHAGRHIPPVTVAAASSPLLLAENVFHEAVHQYVNVQILTGGLLPSDYDSRTAPRMSIPWRSSPGRDVQWEVDRALHAATVYVQLLRWRLDRIVAPQTNAGDRRVLTEAAADAVESCSYLTRALSERVEVFAPRGALFVGRLTRAAEEQCARAARLVDGQRSESLVG